MLQNNDFLGFLKEQDYILWDWNGTLLNDTDLCVDIIDSALLQRGYEGMSKKRYLDIFTIPVYDYYAKLNLDENIHTFEEIANNFVSKYKEQRHKLSMYKNAKDVLSAIRNHKKTKQILFSAAHVEELEFQITNHSLNQVFDEISGASDYHAGSKLERGIKISNSNKSKAGVVIGDTLHDMEIGKEVGLSTIWVSEGHQSLERAQDQKSIDYIFNRSKNVFYKN